MKRLFEKIWDVTKIILFLAILVAIASLMVKYPLLETNIVFSSFFFFWWALTGGFAYDARDPHSSFRQEHLIRPFWLALFVFATLAFIPLGLLLRAIYYSGLRKEDGSLTKKFYFFFNKEDE